jgi:hypothetical protein
MKFVFLFLSVFSLESGAQMKNLSGSCSWVPAKHQSVDALQSTKKIEVANSLPEREKDYLQVSEKGRLYFHTLPNELCKSDVFIVKGDMVQIIDSYPIGDMSFNNSFARVMFYSKAMKSDVIGWVKMPSLRRLTESEIRK